MLTDEWEGVREREEAEDNGEVKVFVLSIGTSEPLFIVVGNRGADLVWGEGGGWWRGFLSCSMLILRHLRIS